VEREGEAAAELTADEAGALAATLNTLRQRLVSALSDAAAGRGTLRASRVQYTALRALHRLGERRTAVAALLSSASVPLHATQERLRPRTGGIVHGPNSPLHPWELRAAARRLLFLSSLCQGVSEVVAVERPATPVGGNVRTSRV